jgi:hypothetical protein
MPFKGELPNDSNQLKVMKVQTKLDAGGTRAHPRSVTCTPYLFNHAARAADGLSAVVKLMSGPGSLVFGLRY